MSYGPADVPPAGGTPGAPGTQAYAGLGQRFVARLLDGILVGVVTSIVVFILPGINARGLLGGVLSSLAALGYFIVMETSRGATLGKLVLGLKVTDADGRSPISTDASFRRNAWMLLGLLNGIPLIGWLAGLASLAIVIVIAVTISNDDRNQGLHDQFAHTLVVETR